LSYKRNSHIIIAYKVAITVVAVDYNVISELTYSMHNPRRMAGIEKIVSCLGESVVFPHFVFFSSRRRHTRSKRDWSSDVCSSDLNRAFYSRTTSSALCQLCTVGVDPILLLDNNQSIIFTWETHRSKPLIQSPIPGRLIRSEERRVGKELTYGCATSYLIKERGNRK